MLRLSILVLGRRGYPRWSHWKTSMMKNTHLTFSRERNGLTSMNSAVFLAPKGLEWSYYGGNDSWGLNIQGLYGTENLPEIDRVNVHLYMTGNSTYGVYLQYSKWDGRIRKKTTYYSKGDPDRLVNSCDRCTERHCRWDCLFHSGRLGRALKNFSKPTVTADKHESVESRPSGDHVSGPRCASAIAMLEDSFESIATVPDLHKFKPVFRSITPTAFFQALMWQLLRSTTGWNRKVAGRVGLVTAHLFLLLNPDQGATLVDA